MGVNTKGGRPRELEPEPNGGEADPEETGRQQHKSWKVKRGLSTGEMETSQKARKGRGGKIVQLQACMSHRLPRGEKGCEHAFYAF